MRGKRNFQELSAKCELLEEMGFTINHEDSDVSYPRTYLHDFEGFDFSATAPDVHSIIYTALQHVYELGMDEGKASIRQTLREALGIDE